MKKNTQNRPPVPQAAQKPSKRHRNPRWNHAFRPIFRYCRRFRHKIPQRLGRVRMNQNILGPSTRGAPSNGTKIRAPRQTFNSNNWPNLRTIFGIFSSGDVDRPTKGYQIVGEGYPIATTKPDCQSNLFVKRVWFLDFSGFSSEQFCDFRPLRI